MRLVPRSLFGRLLAIAAATTAAALLFAAFAIGHVLERFVMRGLDDRLDAQIAVLARATRDDGTLDRARVVDLPGFGQPGSGWSWQVAAPKGGHWASATDATTIPWPTDPGPGPLPDRDRPHPGEASGTGGERLHLRQVSLPTPAGAVVITATGPRRVADRPLREAMLPLLASLALLGGALAAATLIQLRWGLRPLAAMRRGLADIRAGRSRHLPVDQPAELLPLATELNALVDQNAVRLDQARRHAANLAHGLKTPLAALALQLAGRDPDGSLGDALARIDRQIGHHLRRARMAALTGGSHPAVALAPALDDLLAVLRRIHADRAITATTAGAAGLQVAVDPQDLDEMLGNLLDNAWRHARGAVAVTVSADGGDVAIAIDDDGPGLDAAALAEAMLPGRRLDEDGGGHGFGLPITRELAELYGGTLALTRSATLGGLAVRVVLPSGAPD